MLISATLLIATLLTGGSVGNGAPGEVETIRLSDRDIYAVNVSSDGAVLNFITKPEKIILGRDGEFQVGSVNNDIAITSLKENARSNLFVYLLGRRYAFSLNSGRAGGRKIVTVLDKSEPIQLK